MSGACLLCKKPVCRCDVKRHPPILDLEEKIFMSEASKLKIKRWLDTDDEQEKVYKELCNLVSEIVEEDSRLVLGAVYDRLSKSYATQAALIKERATKRLRETKEQK